MNELTQLEVTVLRVLDGELRGNELPQSHVVQCAAASRLKKKGYVMLKGAWYIPNDKGKQYLFRFRQFPSLQR